MWFTLGIREALKGWDRGLKDMCVGEKRKLTIPPALAYGKEGKGKTLKHSPCSNCFLSLYFTVILAQDVCKLSSFPG